METINNDINNGTYEKVYLLTGPETYLRIQARDRLKKALCDPADSLNVISFTGLNVNQNEIIDFANTLPFLAPKRVIFIEDSNIFSDATDSFISFMSEIPDSTCIIFMQDNVDKRGRLYKAIKDNGRVISFNTPDVNDLTLWVLGKLKKEKMSITKAALEQFFDQIGKDMVRLDRELDKLICYKLGSDTIVADDVRSICTISIEDKVFDLVDCLALKNRRRAMEIYNDLLTLKVPPMKILSIISGHYNEMLLIRDMYEHHKTLREMTEASNKRDFVVKKLRNQCTHYTQRQILQVIKDCVDLECDFKTGLLDEDLAVEMIICKYSS